MKSFQPKGYFSLFFIFMLERLYFYGVRALLVLFMVKYLLFSVDKASIHYGWYLGALAFSPILGGLIADLWLGQRKTLFWSFVISIFGCILLAVSSLTSSVAVFYIAMFLIVIGSMLFKPTIYTTLSNIYDAKNDSRRDGGFTLMLLAINLGAFMAPLVCGGLGENIGWWLGFLVAGIFMVLALFLLKYTPANVTLKKTISKKGYQNAFFIMLFVLLAVYLPYRIGDQAVDQKDLAGIMIGSVIFPRAWVPVVFLLPSYVLYLIFPWVWMKLAKIKKEPSTIYKFVWGFAFMIIGLFLYRLSVAGYQRSGVSSLSIVGITSILLGLSEVCIGPIITSLITKVAPKKWAATFVGAWFTIIGITSLFIAYGFQFISGLAPIFTIGLIACALIALILLRAPFKRRVN